MIEAAHTEMMVVTRGLEEILRICAATKVCDGLVLKYDKEKAMTSTQACGMGPSTWAN